MGEYNSVRYFMKAKKSTSTTKTAQPDNEGVGGLKDACLGRRTCEALEE